MQLLPVTLTSMTLLFSEGIGTGVDDREKSANDFYNRPSYELLGIVLLMFFENIFGRRRCLLLASIFTHATSPGWDEEYRDESEEYCLDLLAMSNAAMASILIWYCLTIYPTSMR